MQPLLRLLSVAALCLALAPAASAQVTLTASASTKTVQQGGQVTFDYQVCNDRPDTITSGVYYKANGPVLVGLTLVRSGSVASMTCSPSLSFTLNVPANTPQGTYVFLLEARFNSSQSPVANARFDIQVTPAARSDGSAAEWSPVVAEPWPAVVAAARAIPADVSAYPNPFTQRTALVFTLAEAADVRFAVYDVLGREVAVLADGLQDSGVLEADFEASNLPSGVYVVRLTGGRVVETAQVTLLR